MQSITDFAAVMFLHGNEDYPLVTKVRRIRKKQPVSLLFDAPLILTDDDNMRD